MSLNIQKLSLKCWPICFLWFPGGLPHYFDENKEKKKENYTSNKEASHIK